MDTENVSEEVIREIINDCSAKGVTVDEALAVYVIKLTVLDPVHGFISDEPLGTEDLCKLVNLCIEKLLQENSPYVSTIRMQVEYQTNHRTRKQQIAENRGHVKTHTAPLLKEIVDAKAKSKDDLEKLYKKVIAAIILKSGLGNPTHVGVMKEGTAALQSVFPPSELGQFLSLTRKEKEQQVQELTQIVTGIRLFNRDCQKGGDGIEDLPNLLQQANDTTQKSIEEYLQKIMLQIDALTTALELNLHKHDAEQVTIESYDSEEIMEVSEEEITFLKGCLIAARQLEIYMRKLLAEVEGAQEILNGLLDHLKRRLVQIHDTVRFRTAIPTVQVYPQFIDLSDVWTSLQDEMVLLSSVNSLVWNLQSYVQVLDFIDMDVINYLIGNKSILSDVDRLSSKASLPIATKLYADCTLVTPSIANFQEFFPQYLGFCAWALVAGEGTLIPGNLNMGLIHWKGLYYACSTPNAGMAFAQNPDRFVTEALNFVRRMPELVELLQLQDQLAQQKDFGEKMGKEILAVKHDMGMQTELHPLPPNIDKKYTWNVWELKRRAIQLANIVKSATHSTQTIKSNFRSDVPLQAGSSKDAKNQTMHDSSTSVPTLGSFIFGLRGRKDDKQFVIHLTRPVDE